MTRMAGNLEEWTANKEDAMDYVKPYGVVDSMLAGGALKLSLPPRQLMLRGMLAGAYLGIGTSMAVTAAVETGYWIVGSLLFPFGLALAILLGAEIITGSFALLPVAAADGQQNAGLRQVFANWSWVFLGNLLGSTAYAGLFAIALTTAGDAQINAVGIKLMAIAEAKTNYYASHGASGLLAAFTKGMLCNWMVSLAVVAAYMSTSFSGKILAIWGPTLLFFSQGFEHAVVNMFLIPIGMLLGAPITVSTWWLWNQIPVTLGNLVGGMLFTGLAMYAAHRVVAPVSAPQPQATMASDGAAARADRPGYSPSF
ncbi:MAG: putative formate transporter 1 [Nitrospirae bacterium]|nr:MAG: putative nitrite transporter NirC [Nitrospira sp. OLB3]MBV6469706.1 putative formate transporter 1 [Nitrospirota bacterium]MCK6494451.1 formate/nitrite transporter family protein [Nitrospira sp.]MCK6501576.1 formate/nitrite transporter family protein [Nitrospira sp.]MEB2340098.1 formate/nitrite transporter family protein [Nitrospirales bacterium]